MPRSPVFALALAVVACGEVSSSPPDASLLPDEIALSPMMVEFGNIGIGSASPSQIFEIASAPASPSFVARLRGADNGEFAIVSSTCGEGAPSCLISVAMVPTREGPATAELVLEAEDRVLARSSLAGTAVTATLAVSPALDSFGIVELGEVADRELSIENTGLVPLVVSMSFDQPQFQVASTTCADSIGAGETCRAVVRFTPTAIGTLPAVMTVAAGGATAAAQLVGRGGSYVLVNRQGPGRVAGSGIDCGTNCTMVTTTAALALDAQPAAGAYFAGWGGACSGTTLSCGTTIATSPIQISATFADIPTLSLTVINTDPVGPPVGLGSVTVSPPGDSCGGNGAALATCSYDLVNATVTLTAVDECSSFTGWSGACTGSARTCTLPLAGDRSVTATFDFATCQ